MVLAAIPPNRKVRCLKRTDAYAVITQGELSYEMVHPSEVLKRKLSSSVSTKRVDGKNWQKLQEKYKKSVLKPQFRIYILHLETSSRRSEALFFNNNAKFSVLQSFHPLLCLLCGYFICHDQTTLDQIINFSIVFRKKYCNSYHTSNFFCLQSFFLTTFAAINPETINGSAMVTSQKHCSFFALGNSFPQLTASSNVQPDNPPQ